MKRENVPHLPSSALIRPWPAVGEQEMKKVLAIMPDGELGAPCGACRELMVQLMPDRYGEIEVLIDFEKEKIVTLGELTPKWWIGTHSSLPGSRPAKTAVFPIR